MLFSDKRFICYHPFVEGLANFASIKAYFLYAISVFRSLCTTKRRTGVLDSLLSLIPVLCENCGTFKSPVGSKDGRRDHSSITHTHDFTGNFDGVYCLI